MKLFRNNDPKKKKKKLPLFKKKKKKKSAIVSNKKKLMKSPMDIFRSFTSFQFSCLFLVGIIFSSTFSSLYCNLTSFLPLKSSYRDKVWFFIEKNSKKQDFGVSTRKVTQGSKILAFQQEKSPKEVERFGQPNCFSSFLILV
jgi:hypothetical protein